MRKAQKKKKKLKANIQSWQIASAISELLVILDSRNCLFKLAPCLSSKPGRANNELCVSLTSDPGKMPDSNHMSNL
uniref:Uncharacterized protein n=1 Tax=Nothoprocta perdicaria TaxID=30464 RepID=A0A8C6YLT0_NOTPE